MPAPPKSHVTMLVSRRCNNHCVMCIERDALEGVDLSARRLRRWLKRYRREGHQHLEISGYEPLTRRNIVDLVGEAAALGYDPIRVLTNARPLARPGLAQALVDAGLTAAAVSCHSAGDDEEERIALQAGAFATKLAGIRHLMEAAARAPHPMTLEARVVVMQQNLARLTDIVDLLADLGFPTVGLAFIQPIAHDLTGYRDSVPPYESIRRPLMNALDRGLARGLTMEVDNVPPCQLPQRADLWPRLQLQVPSPQEAPTIPPLGDAVHHLFHRPEKRLAPPCAECRYGSRCAGVDTAYLEHHGADALRPLRQGSPDSSGAPRTTGESAGVDLLFVQIYDYEDEFSLYSPAIATLSAVLKERGHSVGLHVTDWREPDDVFLAAVTAQRPRVVAFSTLSNNWPRARHLIHLLKKRTDLTVIAGGYHPTFAPEDVLRESPVDALCVGEAELALPEYLAGHLAGTPNPSLANFWFRGDEGGDVIRNPPRPPVADLDTLPDPDRELFEVLVDDRASHWAWTTQIQAGRGCTFHCTFCANDGLLQLYGGRQAFCRVRRVERVLAEVRRVVERFPGRDIYFSDEVFPLDEAWLQAFVTGMEELGSPAFNVLFRAELVTPDRVQRLARAGCVRIAMGVEHGDEGYRREMLRRRMSNDTLRRAFDTVRRAGLRTHAFCMIGLPFETDALVDRTLGFMDELAPDGVNCQVFFPLPGSELYELCRRENLLRPSAMPGRRADLLRFIRHVHLSREKLVEACLHFGLLSEGPGADAGPPPSPASSKGSAPPPWRPDSPMDPARRLPPRRVQRALPRGWRADPYVDAPPYRVLPITDGRRTLRIGFAPRGRTDAFYVRTRHYDIAYLQEDGLDALEDPATRAAFHRVLTLVGAKS